MGKSNEGIGVSSEKEMNISEGETATTFGNDISSSKDLDEFGIQSLLEQFNKMDNQVVDNAVEISTNLRNLSNKIITSLSIMKTTIVDQRKEISNLIVHHDNDTIELEDKDKTIENMELLLAEKNKEIDRLKKELQLKDEMMNSLRVSSRVLENNLDQLNQVFSVVGHDLKSPFTAIRGYLEMMKQDIEEGNIDIDIFKESVDRTFNSVNSVLLLIEDALSLSQLDNGKIPFEPEVYSLKDIKEFIINDASIQDSMDKKKISLDTIGDDDAECNIDRKIFMIIIRNLISNSVKFSNKGSNIKINCDTSDDDFNIFELVDQGIGMSETTVNDLLNLKIRSTNGTDGEKGHGLGSRLILKFLKSHQGDIDIKSEIGKGSSFKLIFPKKYSLETDNY